MTTLPRFRLSSIGSASIFLIRAFRVDGIGENAGLRPVREMAGTPRACRAMVDYCVARTPLKNTSSFHAGNLTVD